MDLDVLTFSFWKCDFSLVQTFLKSEVKAELPEPCRIPCLILAAPCWHHKAPGSLLLAHLQERKNLGPLFQFTAH